MAANRWNYNTVGNAALKPEPAQLPQKLPEHRTGARPRPENASLAWLRANVGAVALFAVVLAVFAFMMYHIVTLHADINRSLRTITTQENTLNELRMQNDTVARRQAANVDLETVYEVATTRLGMVYPDANHRILYTEQLSEYVHQNENISD